MSSTRKGFLAVAVVGGLITIGTAIRALTVSGQSAPALPQAVNAAKPVVSEDSHRVAAGTAEATKLLRLIDTNKNGKISRRNTRHFRVAEFDRLDIDHNSELDIKELFKSQLIVVHHGCGRR